MDQLLFTGTGRTGHWVAFLLGHGFLHGMGGWKDGRRHGMILVAWSVLRTFKGKLPGIIIRLIATDSILRCFGSF